EPWMAEPKRHMDVPQGACFGKAYPAATSPIIKSSQKAPRKIRGLIANSLSQRDHTPKHKRRVQHDGPVNRKGPEIPRIAKPQPGNPHTTADENHSQISNTHPRLTVKKAQDTGLPRHQVHPQRLTGATDRLCH